MANVVVSAVCNLRCAYCFAADHLRAWRAGAAPVFISRAAFEDRLDFLDRSGINEIRLIGGEPTLHPRFPELIERARRRGKHIVVFSHGLIPEAALAALEALPAEAGTVLVNLSATRLATGLDEGELARRRSVLRRLGPRALPGWTIDTPAFQLDFSLALIAETGCRRALRVGLAQPLLSGRNRYLHPKQYAGVGERLAAFAPRAAAAGVTLEFDCGFVRCMFSDAELAALSEARADVGWRCNPVLDLDLQAQASHCFPLAGWAQTPLAGPADAASLRARLAQQVRPYRTAGVYKECSTCPYKLNAECPGGCLAATLRRFQSGPLHLNVPLASGLPAEGPDGSASIKETA